MAPYLVCLGTDLRLFDWIWREGWGKAWGVFVWTPVIFDAVRDHFRRLTTVRLEGGDVVLFRFYDPRVMETFLPTCDGRQLSQIFGPVQSYLMECTGQAVVQAFTPRLDGVGLRRMLLAGD